MHITNLNNLRLNFKVFVPSIFDNKIDKVDLRNRVKRELARLAIQFSKILHPQQKSLFIASTNKYMKFYSHEPVKD